EVRDPRHHRRVDRYRLCTQAEHSVICQLEEGTDFEAIRLRYNQLFDKTTTCIHIQVATLQRLRHGGPCLVIQDLCVDADALVAVTARIALHNGVDKSLGQQLGRELLRQIRL